MTFLHRFKILLTKFAGQTTLILRMQLPYFYEPVLKKDQQQFILSETSSKHCVQVLRMKEQDRVQITNGKGLLATARITTAHKKHAGIEILDMEETPAVPGGICLAISPTKNITRIEWLLEKITEIGIAEVWLMDCERSERTSVKWERLNQILISAMLQSRQVFLPLLSNMMKFSSVVAQPQFEHKWIAHCLDTEDKRLLQGVNRQSSQIILIGPEGDFSQKEIDLAIENRFSPVSLGSTRLRTETAGLVATVILNLKTNT